MSTDLEDKNSIAQQQVKNNLHRVFSCLQSSFCPTITASSRDFLGADINFSLAGISYDPSPPFRGGDYLVTQINFVQDINLTLKISDTAASVMLLNALGTSQNKSTKLKDLTELEAGILTSYNEFLYKTLSELFLNPKEINSVLHTVQDEKTLYLTFYVSDGQDAGIIILSFPEFVFRKMVPVSPSENPISTDFFNDSIVETDILIGESSASLEDVKSLELEDLIILENSNLHTMYLKEFENIAINMNPDAGLVVSFEEEDGEDIVNENMNKNIWDSLEVDINACFQKVKMKLGDLREITEGLVVDVASVADNKVFIDVEGKQVAAGELVIIGDKYGVKVTEIYSEAKSEKVEEKTLEVERPAEPEPVQEVVQEDYVEDDDENLDDMDIDEDFDESDFDMDDE